MSTKEAVILFVFSLGIGFAWGQLFSWYSVNRPLYIRVDGNAFKPMTATDGVLQKTYLGISVELENK